MRGVHRRSNPAVRRCRSAAVGRAAPGAPVLRQAQDEDYRACGVVHSERLFTGVINSTALILSLSKDGGAWHRTTATLPSPRERGEGAGRRMRGQRQRSNPAVRRCRSATVGTGALGTEQQQRFLLPRAGRRCRQADEGRAPSLEENCCAYSIRSAISGFR